MSDSVEPVVGMTDTEKAAWEWLAEKRTSLEQEITRVEVRLAELLGAVFTRALQQGRWRLETGCFGDTRPADAATEKILVQLGRVGLSLDWHDSLVIQGGGTSLLVHFYDGEVTLELTALDPGEAEAFRKSLNVDIDLGEWVAAYRAQAVEEIDRQISTLQAKRKACDVG